MKKWLIEKALATGEACVTAMITGAAGGLLEYMSQLGDSTINWHHLKHVAAVGALGGFVAYWKKPRLSQQAN